MSLRDQLAAWNAANRRARWEYQRTQNEAEMKTPNKSAPLALAIVADVADLYMVEVDAVLSRRRTRELAEARMIAAWLLRHEGLSYPRIGHLLDRDHTTVRHGVQKVDKHADLLALATRLQAERDRKAS